MEKPSNCTRVKTILFLSKEYTSRSVAEIFSGVISDSVHKALYNGQTKLRARNLLSFDLFCFA